MDDKGIMSSEIMILLVVIVLIIGIIANFTEKNTYKLNEKISSENIGKFSIELCDNLINNPGTPKNWDSLSNKNNIIPGLSIVNENNATIVNSVSYEKLIALSNDYDQLMNKKLLNDKYKSSITLTPLSGEIENIRIGDDNLENPVTVNRIVSCDFFKKYTIGKFEKGGPCNEYHITPHSCNHFKIFKSWLKKTDYYLLFEKNSYKDCYWTIDSTLIPGLPKLVDDEKIYLNPKIEEKTLLSKDGVIFIHIKQENPKAVIVGVPKDFDKNRLSYDYFVEKQCNFKLQISKS